MRRICSHDRHDITKFLYTTLRTIYVFRDTEIRWCSFAHSLQLKKQIFSVRRTTERHALLQLWMNDREFALCECVWRKFHRYIYVDFSSHSLLICELGKLFRHFLGRVRYFLPLAHLLVVQLHFWRNFLFFSTIYDAFERVFRVKFTEIDAFCDYTDWKSQLVCLWKKSKKIMQQNPRVMELKRMTTCNIRRLKNGKNKCLVDSA